MYCTDFKPAMPRNVAAFSPIQSPSVRPLMVTAPSLLDDGPNHENRRNASPKSHFQGGAIFRPSRFDNELFVSESARGRRDQLKSKRIRGASSDDDEVDRASSRTYKSHFVGGRRSNSYRHREQRSYLSRSRSPRSLNTRTHHRQQRRSDGQSQAREEEQNDGRNRTGVMTRSQRRRIYSPTPSRKSRHSIVRCSGYGGDRDVQRSRSRSRGARRPSDR